MAITITGVVLDTPEAKVFDIAVPENDPIRTSTGPLTYTGSGMTSLRATPQEYFMVDTTNLAVNATVSCRVSIPAITATAITFVQCSVAGAAVARTFRVYIHTRSFFA